MSATILRASVIIDYQNVHLTGAKLFGDRATPLHHYLIHPVHYATRALYARNRKMKPGYALAELHRVLVYRGLPSPEDDPVQNRANQAHKAEWKRDSRVIEVDLRPLSYDYERDADGRYASDARGKRIIIGKREKGVDVLCALALLREARRDDIDVAVLASQDTDLAPALDEALDWTDCKIETLCWYKKGCERDSKNITPKRGRIWNTRLEDLDFDASIDRTVYTF
ncbi:hypothetical protein [Sinomonas atrocyanea]|uniref:hypothetical protein n=1 Tax=Sinomonas atrocyanea TaxID=37927 RepID=UPI002857981C|nr:hypothetical protein [Sinomonas atrocyanea]MDR6623037.1 hypothetical protein [Sinomonas atrocyanea]